MLGFVPVDHGSGASLSNQKGSVDIHGKGALEICIGGLQEGFVRDDTSCIYVDIDASEISSDLVDCGVDLLSGGYVSLVVFHRGFVPRSQFKQILGRLG